MADDWRRLGRFVAAERARLGLSPAQLAAQIGLSKRTIENVEAGGRDTYRHTTLSRIEDALGWEPGSVERILAGGDPARTRDPVLEQLAVLWPSLTPRQRRAVLELVSAFLER